MLKILCVFIILLFSQYGFSQTWTISEMENIVTESSPIQGRLLEKKDISLTLRINWQGRVYI
ncbi:hypothetical protein SAMN06298216_1718 [Spirosomataceae bacterium TFI 002]|nr:hypothetical protein SAMN06298216_1718 [Spirosomataceae bacterium TFI 002]